MLIERSREYCPCPICGFVLISSVPTLESSSAMAEEWTFARKNGQVELTPPEAAFTSEAEEMIGDALRLGREYVECFIQEILYGLPLEPRLPIFTEICPDDQEADDLQHNSTAS